MERNKLALLTLYTYSEQNQICFTATNDTVNQDFGQTYKEGYWIKPFCGPFAILELQTDENGLHY